MISYLKKLFQFPSISLLPLKTCAINFSLDRLVIGVDNIHYDVYLSEGFCTAIHNIVIQLIAKHSQSEQILGIDKSNLIKDRDSFKQLCKDIMLDSVNKAKGKREIQIDFLSQVAVTKRFLEEIRRQYEFLIERIKNAIRESDISHQPDKVLQLTKEMMRIQQNKKTILHLASQELFQYLADIQNLDIREIREINFGGDTVLPNTLFCNSLLYQEDPFDDLFMMEQYDILLGRRLEDPDKYDVLISFLKEIMKKICDKDTSSCAPDEWNLSVSDTDNAWEDCISRAIDSWLMEVENIDILFNWLQTKHRYNLLKKQKGSKDELSKLNDLILTQRKLLHFLFKELKPIGIIERMVAAYEMQSVYLEYCPPLIPQLVVQYLIARSVRKSVENRLKRLKKFYGRSFSLKPLEEVIRRIKKVDTRIKKLYLIRFLKGFVRYHRDLRHYNLIKDAMDSIKLVTDEKIIKLSRANNSLYEYLLPDERVSDEKPIMNHVIIKADIRGSTDITHLMLEKGLNPATYFSLNLFDPITGVLPEYGAEKVFVEGDAMILSIFEREDTPSGWYGVARACGLALNILEILKQCNMKCSENGLPIIELGIGISYKNGSPAFLFDGNHRIMISSAINLADRLSGCSKSIRKRKDHARSPFNLFVYQNISEEDMSATADDLFLRYNVNGIELSAAAFEKLLKEIDLKAVSVSNPDKEAVTMYTGRFPSVSGQSQQLLIREARIPLVKSEELYVERLTHRKYYEVCSNPQLYEHIKKIVGREK